MDLERWSSRYSPTCIVQWAHARRMFDGIINTASTAGAPAILTFPLVDRVEAGPGHDEIVGRSSRLDSNSPLNRLERDSEICSIDASTRKVPGVLVQAGVRSRRGSSRKT
jgi:hypothetical protein